MDIADRYRGAPRRALDRTDKRGTPAPAEGRVVGVLLCGGRSERMGADKALLELGGTALIDYPLGALSEVCDEVVLACGASPRYQHLGLPLALDAFEDAGPLAGLHAGLEAARSRGAAWALVLACDMPRADADTLRALLARARSGDLDACLLGIERGSQPTYAAYHVRCADAVRAALEAGRRRLVAPLDSAFEGRPLRSDVVPAGELGAGPEGARNLNTPAELAAERVARGLAVEEVAP